MTQESFESMLTGGHPNSLGRTVEVVDIILENSTQLEELYNCYFSQDEVVRLRTSSALKRVCKEHPEWLVPYLDRLLAEISTIDQASTQWTLANLFQMLAVYMSKEQRGQAEEILKRNLETHKDWIVLNTTMDTLGQWAAEDTNLKDWILPHLARISTDKRKSVSGRAKKLQAAFAS
ncbi:MAG: hypothetical protein AAF639_29695 [Chloroflexota bacterium]